MMNSLAEGTNFTILQDDKVLNMRDKVSTPLTALNCMLGGGIPFGTIINSYGLPKAGKSTLLYVLLGRFLQEYPEGIGMIIDTEASADSSRVSAMGVDISRVLRINPSSIEDGFISINKVLGKISKNKDLSNAKIFILWDTLTKGMAQDGSTNSRMNAQDRARIIKNYMSPLMAEIEKFDCIIGLLNQAIYETDAYGNRKIKSGGGIALEHDVHLGFRFEKYKSENWEGKFMVGKWTRLSIEKSKISPEMYNIPIYLDITRGGSINEVKSFIEYMIDCEFIINKSGWYRLTGILDNEDLMDEILEQLRDYDKSYRYNDLVHLAENDERFCKLLEYALCKHISNIYKLQANIIKEYMDNLKSELMPLVDELEEEVAESNED